MTTEGKNFSGEVPPSIIDTEYHNCNFAQPAPVDTAGVKTGVDIFEGDSTPRVFIDCLVTNCELPTGSTCKRKATLRDNVQVISTDTVTIDSEVVEVINYADIIYGHFKDGEYVYLAEPHVLPCSVQEEEE